MLPREEFLTKRDEIIVLFLEKLPQPSHLYFYNRSEDRHPESGKDCHSHLRSPSEEDRDSI
jgi:hypothetical protein